MGLSTRTRAGRGEGRPFDGLREWDRVCAGATEMLHGRTRGAVFFSCGYMGRRSSRLSRAAGRSTSAATARSPHPLQEADRHRPSLPREPLGCGARNRSLRSEARVTLRWRRTMWPLTTSMRSLTTSRGDAAAAQPLSSVSCAIEPAAAKLDRRCITSLLT